MPLWEGWPCGTHVLEAGSSKHRVLCTASELPNLNVGALTARGDHVNQGVRGWEHSAHSNLKRRLTRPTHNWYMHTHLLSEVNVPRGRGCGSAKPLPDTNWLCACVRACVCVCVWLCVCGAVCARAHATAEGKLAFAANLVGSAAVACDACTCVSASAETPLTVLHTASK